MASLGQTALHAVQPVQIPLEAKTGNVVFFSPCMANPHQRLKCPTRLDSLSVKKVFSS